MDTGYDALAEVYDRIGLAEYATRATPALMNYALGAEVMGRDITDLGSGTGASMSWLTKHGYLCTGVDRSQMMMDTALNDFHIHHMSFRPIVTDFSALEGSSEADVVLSLNTLNEVSSIHELSRVFDVVARWLRDERYFVFDLLTIAGIMAQGEQSAPILYDAEDLTVVQDLRTSLETSSVTTSYYVFREAAEHTYSKAVTSITRRAFPVKAVIGLLQRSGLAVQNVLDEHLKPYAGEESATHRVYFLARKQ
jgi:hypothetical protein